jgi:hypothetical protein
LRNPSHIATVAKSVADIQFEARPMGGRLRGHHEPGRPVLATSSMIISRIITWLVRP